MVDDVTLSLGNVGGGAKVPSRQAQVPSANAQKAPAAPPAADNGSVRVKLSAEAKLKQAAAGESAPSGREEALKKLANSFPVNDTRFTIFKQDGKFVTRFTNVRTGEVTYFPEPDVVAAVSRSNAFAAGVQDTLV